MKARILCFHLFLLCSLTMQAQWEWLNPHPQGNQLESIFMVDSLNWWCAGKYGTIMKTLDGGQNWDIMPSGTREYLNDIWFADRTHGWAVGSHHTILATHDGGETWVKQNGPASDWSHFYSVCFIDTLCGWVAGSDSGLLKTTDGGDTWTIMQRDSLTFCTAIQFTDPGNGWVLKGGDLWHTPDGGETWTRQYDEYIYSENSFHFSDSLHGCLLSYSGNYRTNDGGQTWIPMFHPPLAADEPFLKDSMTIFLYGFGIDTNFEWHATIIRTTDGGMTWDTTVINEITYLTSITGTANTVAGCGPAGAIYSSTDNGGNWRAMTESVTNGWLTSVWFDRDNLHGWICAQDGNLLMTDDGGRTWRTKKISDGILNTVCFLNALKGFAGGDKDTLYRTSDGGNTWEPLHFQNAGYTEICFPDSLHGWLATKGGAIYKSIDGGNTWQKNKQLGQVKAISFPDKDHGWSVEQNTRIFATKDGGTTWKLQPSNISPWEMDMTDVCFVDSLRGWATGSSGRICRTVDGGKNWSVDDTTVRYSDWIEVVHFADSNTGWLAVHQANWYNFVLKTTDGGRTWDTAQMVSGNLIYGIHAWDSTRVFLTGNDGTILRYTGKPNAVPESPAPAQWVNCYPNPSGGLVRFRFDLETGSMVTLTLYDANGRQLACLARRPLPAGPNELQVDLRGYPAGMYICELRSGTRRAFGKIILVK